MSAVLQSFSPSHHAAAASPQSSSSDTNSVKAEIKMAARSLARPLLFESLDIQPINVLVSLHASVKAFVGLDQSPLHFGGYHRQFVRTTSFALGQSIARHYISGTLFRAGWVVGRVWHAITSVERFSVRAECGTPLHQWNA